MRQLDRCGFDPILWSATQKQQHRFLRASSSRARLLRRRRRTRLHQRTLDHPLLCLLLHRCTTSRLHLASRRGRLRIPHRGEPRAFSSAKLKGGQAESMKLKFGLHIPTATRMSVPSVPPKARVAPQTHRRDSRVVRWRRCRGDPRPRTL